MCKANRKGKYYIYSKWYVWRLKSILSTIKEAFVCNWKVIVVFLAVIISPFIVDSFFKIGLFLSSLLISGTIITLVMIRSKIDKFKTEIYLEKLNRIAYCPKCNHKLRTGLSRQCFNCGHSWYDQSHN